MQMFNFFCASEVGQKHAEKGLPNEDYASVVRIADGIVFTCADGHSDPLCFRSNIGAETVCKIAEKKLTGFCRELKERHRENDIFNDETAETHIRSLISQIFTEWREKTAVHLRNNPYTTQELAVMEQKRRLGSVTIQAYDNNEELQCIYGTTFAAALLTDKYLLLLRQGDGVCSVMNANGCYEEPVQWDERCFGGISTSVGNEDAVASCRFAVIDIERNPVSAVFLGSDGISEAFGENPGLVHSFFDSMILFGEENGDEALGRHLQEALPGLSANGIGGDVSVCGVYNADAVGKFNEKFQLRKKINTLTAQLEDAEIKAQSAANSPMLRIYERSSVNSKTAVENAEKKYMECRCELYSALCEAGLVANSCKVKHNSAVLTEDDIASFDFDSIFPEALPEIFIDSDRYARCRRALSLYGLSRTELTLTQGIYKKNRAAYNDYTKKLTALTNEKNVLAARIAELQKKL